MSVKFAGREQYIYTNAHGDSLFRVIRRTNPKRFHQERWEHGKWVRGIRGVPRVLYHLPEILEAAKRSDTVYIGEGEKDADAMRERGVIATTNPMGAGENKWLDEFSLSLVGVRLAIVVWDRDTDGRKHALRVAESLRRADVPVVFRRPRVGKDVSDHLAAGHGLDELVRGRAGRPLAPTPDVSTAEPREPSESTAEPAVYQLAVLKLREHAEQHGLPAPTRSSTGWEACCPAHDDRHPSLGVRVGDHEPIVFNCQKGCLWHEIMDALGIDRRDAFERRRSSGGGGGKLTYYGPADLARKPKPLRWLIRGVWPAESYGPFGGKQKTLKSITAMAGALALATGKPMLGHERWSVPEPMPVLYVHGEGGYNTGHRRVQRIARDIYGVRPAQLKDVPFHLMDGIAPMNSDYFRERIEWFVSEYGRLGLVVLDSLYNFHDAGVEVSNLYERGNMLTEFQHWLAETCGSALWVIDHFRKSAKSTDLDEYMQSGMAQWADSWWNAEHRRDYDPTEGRAWLRVNIGTRQGSGGSLVDIDFDEGPYDEDVGDYLRPMRVEVHPAASRIEGAAEMHEEVVLAVGNNPGIVTRWLLKQRGVTEKKIAAAEQDGLIEITEGSQRRRMHHLTPLGEQRRDRRVTVPSESSEPTVSALRTVR